MLARGDKIQMKKKAVFFDLYGTLINIRTDESDISTYEILSRYLAYHSVFIPPDILKKIYFEKVQQHISQSRESFPEVDVYKIFFDIMHSFGNKKYSQNAVVDISMLFRSLTIRRFEAFDGIYDVLAEICRKYKTALISDAQWVFTEPEIEILGIDRFFKYRVFSSRYGYKKPDKRLFNIAMKKIEVKAEDSIYIGDNPVRDLVGSKMAGMKFLLFRSDCKTYNGFQADGCFNEYHELEYLLTSI